MVRITSILSALAIFAVAASVQAAPAQNNNTVRSNRTELMSPDGFGFSSNGDVTYLTPDASSGEVFLVHHPAIGGQTITLEGQDFTTSMVGKPACSSNGEVSFQCVGPGIDGVYASSVSGGTLITLRGSSFGNQRGAPSMSSNGSVAFLEQDGVYVCDSISSTPVLTIQGQNFVSMGRPACNNSLDVCVSVLLDAGVGLPPEPAVFVQHAGGGFTGTIDLPPDFRLTSSQPKIIDNKKGLLVSGVSSSASGSTEDVLLCEFDELQSSYDFHVIGTFSDGMTCDALSISPDGSSYCATRGQGTSLVWSPRSNVVGPDSAGYLDPVTILSVGDPLGTSTVSSISIADGSAQLDGSVMFFASLADGSSGLYLTTLPEPTTLISVALLASLALLRSRRAT